MRVRRKEDSRQTPFSLTKGKEYEVLGIAADHYYRIVDDDGEPVLYSRRLFRIVDRSRPKDWVKKYGEEGELYAYPPEIGEPGFFEDWHDGVASARKTFAEFLRARGLDAPE
jgi:hypothetical protein